MYINTLTNRGRTYPQFSDAPATSWTLPDAGNLSITGTGAIVCPLTLATGTGTVPVAGIAPPIPVYPPPIVQPPIHMPAFPPVEPPPISPPITPRWSYWQQLLTKEFRKQRLEIRNRQLARYRTAVITKAPVEPLVEEFIEELEAAALEPISGWGVAVMRGTQSTGRGALRIAGHGAAQMPMTIAKGRGWPATWSDEKLIRYLLDIAA